MTQSTSVGDQNGPAIRALRKRSGLSVRELVKRLEEQEGLTVHPNHVRNIETGARGASETLIGGIARVLKVDIVAILKDPSQVKVDV